MRSASNSPLTSAFLEGLTLQEQSTLLLALCNSTPSVREAVASSRAAKELKLAERDLNFSFDVSVHKGAMNDYYGHQPGGCYRMEDNSDDEGVDADDLDLLYDEVIPQAWEELESSFKKIVKDTMPVHSYRNKKHAVVAVVAIATGILSSSTQLAAELKGDEALYLLVFNKALVPLFEKCTRSDLASFKSEPILATFKKALPKEYRVRFYAPLEERFFAGI